MILPRPARFVAAALLVFATFARAEVRVTETPRTVRVDIDARLFTELVLRGAPHVYYWPLMGPGETPVTRAWPMEERPGEEKDHPHHRSMWFSHGLVNGIDFWSEAASHGARQPKQPIGKIVHDKVVETKSGKTEGHVTTTQNWVAPDGSIPVTSTQTLRVFQGSENERECEFSTTLTAGEKEVLFGDTKEGTFAIRIAESMRLRGAKGAQGAGHILNSQGLKDEKVWGTSAKWVAMYGPVAGKPMTIAIMDHPSNPRHPTRWHARDYGLFAANPFCEHEMDKSKPAGAGDFKLEAGKSVTFRYRIVIHTGEPAAEQMNERFAQFAK
jgi:hypothetical protein